jgi:hypothetical protein
MNIIHTVKGSGFTINVFAGTLNEYRLTEDSTGIVIDSAGMSPCDLEDDKRWLSTLLTQPGFDPRKIEFSCNGTNQDEFDEVLRNTGHYYVFP